MAHHAKAARRIGSGLLTGRLTPTEAAQQLDTLADPLERTGCGPEGDLTPRQRGTLRAVEDYFAGAVPAA